MNSLFYQLLLPLLAAHMLGDFVFQSDNDVKNKKNTVVFLKHITIVTLLSYLFTGFWCDPYIALSILITHTLIDLIKRTFKKDSLIIFLADQAAHLLVILVLSFYMRNSFENSNMMQSFWYEAFGVAYLESLTILISLVLASKFSGIIVSFIIKPYQNISLTQEGTGSQKNIGRLIGQLERILILILFLADMAAVVGFLITAKSILRYGEIKNETDKTMVEYVLIGTLISFAFGMSIGLATTKFLSVIH